MSQSRSQEQSNKEPIGSGLLAEHEPALRRLAWQCIVRSDLNAGLSSSVQRNKRLRGEINYARKNLKADDLVSLRCFDSRDECFLATIFGPPSSPYEGGIFRLVLDCANGYPRKPPVVRFLTKVHHPLVNDDGKVPFENLGPRGWSPVMTISALLMDILTAFSQPPLEDAFEGEDNDGYRLYCNEIANRAVEATRLYATGKRPDDGVIEDLIDKARVEEARIGATNTQ